MLCGYFSLVSPGNKNGTIVEFFRLLKNQLMKVAPFLFLLFLTLFVLSGCGAIETIFKAGMWWAFFLVALVIVIIVWIVSKTRK